MKSTIPQQLDTDGIFSLLHQNIPKSIDPATLYLLFSEELIGLGYCPWGPPF
jgi:hypothetical protein